MFLEHITDKYKHYICKLNNHLAFGLFLL
ncbi:hypothetical protein OIU79_030500 [Salix purpurea]|uniref:Uncharacterized protein n=1 Tax=Salix purpurea TaxID=77065 RepID=A0A9Q0V8N4_SALPP|nr:hypothetical protein OIU79_030500 [Salix purpurea]